jgi:hypothetical protein|tara:strand:- start:169 stop:1023 length:855 start_codon:yes stop_codon:yes gene_type:complete
MFQINWKLKALLYTVFGFFGFKTFFYLIQKRITKRSVVGIRKINDLWEYHAKSIENNNIKSILEVGAGKSLEQNIYLSYRFNNKVKQTAIDINRMIDFDLINQASVQLSTILNLENKGVVKNINQLEELYNINYKAPFKLSSLIKSNEKFDMSISTTTLEHFNRSELKNYLFDLKSVLAKNCLVSAVIDYSDHYSHTDKNIGGLNFLSYSEKNWKKYNNKYLFQNRLRHQDYREFFNSSGYEIKDMFSGDALLAPKEMSNEFDASDKDTFIGWAYFLIGLKTPS